MVRGGDNLPSRGCDLDGIAIRIAKIDQDGGRIEWLAIVRKPAARWTGA
jgi:hypothetical protein